MGVSDPSVMEDWARLVHVQAQRIAGAAGIDPRLARLWEAVAADLAFPWTIDALAERAGTSGEHLRRLCQRQMNRSPLRHVTYLRMRYAASLLASDSYTVEAVAEQVGYNNPFAFSTAFKRSLGVSPAGYRDKIALR
jgi:transcriptional regulator GlxA family with amidase domain